MKLKKQILRYKKQNKLSYRALANALHLNNHQSLVYWLENDTREPIDMKIQREFEALTEG